MKFRATTNEIADVVTALPLTCLGNNLKVESGFFQHQVSKLPREETLSLCAKLNTIFCYTTDKREPNFQENVLRLLCTQNWLDNSDLQRMLQYAKKQKGTLDENLFFSRPSCLELMRWSAVWAKRAETGGMNGISRKHGFARSMLMAFEFWSNRTQRRIWQSDKYEQLPQEQQHFESLRILREASLWQVPTFNPLWQLGRGYELYIELFFAKNPELRREVEIELGMDLEDYITCVAGLLSMQQEWFNKQAGIIDNFEFDPSRLCDNAPHMKTVMEQFMSRESQNPEQLAKSYERQTQDQCALTDFRPLRERPILLIDGGRRATFIDTTFVAERASNGLLFRSSRLIGDEAMKEFGVAFEEYAIRRLTRYTNSLRANGHAVTGHPRVGAKSLASSQQVEFSDYLIVCGRTLVLIEIKGKWLQDKAIASLTAEDYWKEIYNKYVVDDSGRKSKRKGVSQLADSIEGWLDGRLAPEITLPVADFDAIIPIMLVYDCHLPVLYHGKFLARELQKLLPGAQTEAVPHIYIKGKTVLNLCLLSMDDFEEFENRILKRDLADLMREYSAKYPTRDVSAGAFLARIPSEKFPPQPGIVAEGHAALDQACKRLFGKTTDAW